ncbi:MAG: hypothetical protein IBX57_00560 [Gammaproteobacteria bacterium]|nr:hypothetical protein [Gammaproteobacteria bacterium]
MVDEINLKEMPIRLLYVRFLMCSFLYYFMHEVTPWSDTQYDLAAKRLLEEWDTFDHPHKYLTDKESLSAGTGYSIRYYPTIVKISSVQWRDNFTL